MGNKRFEIILTRILFVLYISKYVIIQEQNVFAIRIYYPNDV